MHGIVVLADYEAVYSCMHGFRLIGNKIRFCNPAGQWISSEPVCKCNLYYCCLYFYIISTLITVNMHIVLCDNKNNKSCLVFLRNFSLITDFIFN